MPKITLATIQSAANTKFSDFEVVLSETETVAFSPVLRLPKAKRAELAAAFSVETRTAEDAGVDVFDLYRDAFRITAKTEGGFDALAAAVGDDPAVWQELFSAYSEETEAGEV